MGFWRKSFELRGREGFAESAEKYKSEIQKTNARGTDSVSSNLVLFPFWFSSVFSAKPSHSPRSKKGI
jgi:hypothetical protein